MSTFIDLVCVKCQEPRYRSKIPITPDMKPGPDAFVPLGDQPPPETYEKAPRCFACDGPLAPMPSSEGKAKMSREEAAALREQVSAMKEYSKDIAPETTPEPNVETLFECRPDEGDMQVSILDNNRLLIRTTKRLLILKNGV